MLRIRPIQLLACEFELATDSEVVAGCLSALRPSAVQECPILQHHRLHIRSAGDRFDASEDGVFAATLSTIDETVSYVERRLHELALGPLSDWTKLHAGCGVWNGRRFLVVGDRGAGKTTMMARLLFEGCSVEGDEMVLLRDGDVMAYPRRFGIRRRTLKLVPQIGRLAPHLLEGPEADQPGGFHVLALDPAQVGVPWRITAGPAESSCPAPVTRRRGSNRVRRS
jgi:hypothetical protein